MTEDIKQLVDDVNRYIEPKVIAVVTAEAGSIWTYRVQLDDSDTFPPRRLTGFTTEDECVVYLEGVLDAVAIIGRP